MNRLLSVSLAGALGLAACAKQPAAPSAKPSSQPVAAEASKDGDGRLPADTVVATWKGGQLTYGQLMEKNATAFKQLRRKYVQDLYGREQQAVEMQVVEQLVEAAAKKEGLSADDYMKKMVGEPEVTEAEAKDFFDKNLASRGQPFEAMKDRIIGFLKGQKAQTSVAAVLTRLKEEAGVKIDLPEPEELKVNLQLAGRPMKGKQDAKITIVEFSDFQCPYCSRAAPEVDKIVEAMPNDVKLYFLHFPLSFHEHAKPAAIAAECAHQQGKFWELHDKLFGNQQKLDDASIQGYAKEIGLDAAKFDACLKSPETEKAVKADMDQGNMAGVTGTPFFLVNGKPHRGPPSVAELKAILNPQAAAAPAAAPSKVAGAVKAAADKTAAAAAADKTAEAAGTAAAAVKDTAAAATDKTAEAAGAAATAVKDTAAAAADKTAEAAGAAKDTAAAAAGAVKDTTAAAADKTAEAAGAAKDTAAAAASAAKDTAKEAVDAVKGEAEKADAK